MARLVASMLFLVLVLFAADATSMTVTMETELRGNPIRKVVTMLQDMQAAVKEEGITEKALFDKFMCYCGTTAGNLESSIQTGTAQVEAQTSSLSKNSAEKSQLAQDIIQHKVDEAEANKSLDSSKAMREKEADEFAASSGEAKANILAMDNALQALKKGLTASLLQSTAGLTIKNVLEHSPAISDSERGVLLSFLENGEGGSDQIVGIVEQMKETMEADLKSSTADEGEARSSFSALSGSKDEEIAAARGAIESKMRRAAELAVSVAQGKADLEDTQEALDEDKSFKANLASTCAAKSKSWDQRSASRAQEVQAISETVEMLSSDEALELFKKTLPSPASSFVQVSSRARVHTSTHLRARAATSLRKLLSSELEHSASVSTILLKLKATGRNGKSITSVIDGMIATFQKEQVDDDRKKEFCTADMSKTEKEVDALKQAVADIDADVAEKKDAAATLVTGIATIQQGIADLDRSVVEATQQRKDEHAEYVATAAANQAAAELIGMAKNRMNKFYSPNQYKALPTTTEADAYGFVQLQSSFVKAPGAGGVMAMMEQMIKDVAMDLQEGKLDEESAQKEYEEAMNDAAAKRLKDSKLMVEKNGNKADGEVELQAALTGLKTKGEQLDLAEEKMHDLQINCDHFLKGYAEATANRVSELATLKEGKAVLGGGAAASGFLQQEWKR